MFRNTNNENENTEFNELLEENNSSDDENQNTDDWLTFDWLSDELDSGENVQDSSDDLVDEEEEENLSSTWQDSSSFSFDEIGDDLNDSLEEEGETTEQQDDENSELEENNESYSEYDEKNAESDEEFIEDESDENKPEEFWKDWIIFKIKNKLNNFKEEAKNLDKEKTISYLKDFKSSTLNFFKNPIVKFYIVFILFILLSLFISFTWYRLHANYNILNERLDNLYLVGEYALTDEWDFSADDYEQLTELFERYYLLDGERQRLQGIFDQFQSPYENFLINYFLPSLNVWKNPYDWYVDTWLIWKDFLDNNPYIDTNLIQHWSDFFSEYNEVENIRVWGIQELDEDYFYISVDVGFSTETRRDFLKLVSSLSATSNKRNVSLINEFTYDLFEKIKNNYEFEEEMSTKEKNKKVWQMLHEWVGSYDDENNNQDYWFINSEIIAGAMNENVDCDLWWWRVCYEEFREKFSNIHSLAYTVWDPNLDKYQELGKFYNNLPPVLNIQNFTFRKIEGRDVSVDDMWYNGNISINVYWRNLSSNELDEISQELWKICFWEDSWSLDHNVAADLVQEELDIATQDQVEIDTNIVANYNDLLNLFDDIWDIYNNLNNYQRSIRLFEIYRMLNENNLCG